MLRKRMRNGDEDTNADEIDGANFNFCCANDVTISILSSAMLFCYWFASRTFRNVVLAWQDHVIATLEQVGC